MRILKTDGYDAAGVYWNNSTYSTNDTDANGNSIGQSCATDISEDYTIDSCTYSGGEWRIVQTYTDTENNTFYSTRDYGVGDWAQQETCIGTNEDDQYDNCVTTGDEWPPAGYE